MKKSTFFSLLFLAATGLASGCFFEIYLNGSGKDQLMDLLSGFFTAEKNSLPFWPAFWQNLRGGLLFLLLTFPAPILPVLFPFSLLFLFFRSMAVGFSAAMMMEVFGMKGLFYSSVTLIPSGILQILLFSALTALSIHQIHPIFCKKHSRKAPQRTAGPYLYTYAAGLGILVLICLMQVILLHTVISP